MSGGDGRKIDIDMVHNSIEQCLKLYMSKKDVANELFLRKNIEPQVTEVVWQRLEEQNQEFFKAYYLKLMVIDQIEVFNRLLAEQVDLMRRTGLVSIPSLPNGSNISSVQQIQNAGENLGCTLGTNDVHIPMVTNLPNTFISHGPPMNSCMQSALGMSVNGRSVDVPSNMLLAQSSNMGIRPSLNGVGSNMEMRPTLNGVGSNMGIQPTLNGMGSNMGIQPTLNGVGIKREGDYATSSFNYAPPSNFMRSHSAMAGASMPSFSSVDSSLQSLNGSILDTDASSFGFLGQFSQNFNLQNMTSNPDIFDCYSEAPFLSSNSNNILDPRGNIGRFG